jgi:rSAM/selenodomain-associated transferase 1
MLSIDMRFMNTTIHNSSIIIFIKYPGQERVKTRLSLDLGKTITEELYKNFVFDLLKTLENINIVKHIYFTPNSAQDQMISWLGTGYDYIPQNGKNLGERMKNAFINEFKQGGKKVIIIGSDIPDLPPDLIMNAFLSLKKNDAVIGPTYDGGYYLLGFIREKFLQEVFKEISWSTENVFDQTMNIFKKNNYRVHILRKWRDIDTIEDVKKLITRNRSTFFKKSKTISYLLKQQERLT